MPEEQRPEAVRSGAPDYDVVALSVPIVYTLDGDHDPNGLMYALRPAPPLLHWLDARGRSDNEYLPGLHRRRQLIQLVVDGLWRYGRMLERLQTDDGRFADLLRDLGGPDGERRRDHTADTNQAGIDDRHGICGRGGRDPRAAGDPPEPPRHPRRGHPRPRRADRRARPRARPRPGRPGPVARRVARRRCSRSTRPWSRPCGGSTRASTPRRRGGRLRLGTADVQRPPPRRDRPGRRHSALRPLQPAAARPARPPAGVARPPRRAPAVRLRNDIRDRPRRAARRRAAGSAAPAAPASGTATAPTSAGTRTRPRRPGGPSTYHWACPDEGVWPINDLADVRGTEEGSNVHGLFGALIVGDPGTTYHDPETGWTLHGRGARGRRPLRRHPRRPASRAARTRTASTSTCTCDGLRSHREFTVFIHDEPEIHSGLHVGGEHGVMPLSYRAEPMPNRLPHRMRRFAERTPPEPAAGPGRHRPLRRDDRARRRPRRGVPHRPHSRRRVPGAGRGRGAAPQLVAVRRPDHPDPALLQGRPGPDPAGARRGQGDPRLPPARAPVAGDPAGHRRNPARRAGSQLLDSITIGPQTAYTIDPLYGSGSRQHAPGDVIWHCHLYPHFHHGMWGLWRSFDRLVDGITRLPRRHAVPTAGAAPGPRPRPGRRDSTPASPGSSTRRSRRRPRRRPRCCRAQVRPPLPAADAAALDAREGGLRAGCRRRGPGRGRCSSTSTATQVDWNDSAGLPPPRILHYDIEVASGSASSTTTTAGSTATATSTGSPASRSPSSTRRPNRCRPSASRHLPSTGPKPFFPRANQGDIVESTFINTSARSRPTTST